MNVQHILTLKSSSSWLHSCLLRVGWLQDWLCGTRDMGHMISGEADRQDQSKGLSACTSHSGASQLRFYANVNVICRSKGGCTPLNRRQTISFRSRASLKQRKKLGSKSGRHRSSLRKENMRSSMGWIDSLPCECEDLSSNPRMHIKTRCSNVRK